MRFLTVSDEIVPSIYSLNIKQRFGTIQSVLSCGDLPYYYLEFIVTMLGVPLYYIYGNHDTIEHSAGGETLTGARGCTLIEDRVIMQEGLLIGGLGGSIRYNNDDAPQYSEQQMLMRVWRMTPQLLLNKVRHGRHIDILMTHAPPLGIHNGPSRPHKGFKALLMFMERFQPRYLIHGHIHRSYGFSPVTETRYRDTLIVNTAGHRLLGIADAETPTLLDGKAVGERIAGPSASTDNS
ncbi:MAG: metallophosphoesterase [Roseiflexaceae bacterium]|nr:metallophosphoesterase [Roseiflexaceae bacterium]